MSRLMALCTRGVEKYAEKRNAVQVGPSTGQLSPYGGGNFEESKHPRGGRPENKGEFSSAPGAGATPPSRPGQYVPQHEGAPPVVGSQREQSIASGKGDPDSSWAKKFRGESNASMQPANGVDHAQRHAFTKSQLSAVADPIRGVMAALHAHPDVQAGGAIVTQAFAPEQARQVYDHLRKTAAPPKNGSASVGQAVDLGQGRLGYATPAGSMIVWPADSSGRHQVKYTNQTGVVARAMTGANTGGNPAATGNQGATRPAMSPPGVPMSQQGPAGSLGSGQSIPGQPAQPQSPATHVPPPVPPPVIARPPSSLATPKQLESVSALFDKPQNKPKAGGPQTPREIADATKQQIEQATALWQQELAGGLSTKGNARWRSYVAALNSIHGHQTKLANDHERQEKINQRAAAKGNAGNQGGSVMTEHEAAAAKNAPEAFKELQAMREGFGPGGYEDAVKQLARSKKPWEGRRLDDPGQGRLSGFEGANVEQPPEARQRPPVPSGAVPPSERDAMSRLGIDPQTGKPGGSVKAEYNPLAGKNKWGQPKWTNARQVFEGAKAKRDAEAKMREQARAGFETPAVKQPDPIEGSGHYQSWVKQNASDWDMKPEDFHGLAKDLYEEFHGQHSQREKAKQTLKSRFNLNARTAKQLVEKGADEQELKKGFDQLEDLADEFPGIFRRSDDPNETHTNDHNAQTAFDLLSENAKPVPSITSPEFMEHIADYLNSQLKRHGSSGTQGGHAADDDDLSAVPFAERRAGLVERYSEYLAQRIRDAAADTAKPTAAQAKAGNYKKGHLTWNGLPITIETAKGMKRKPQWPAMSAHYGYINRTEGKDGDHVDVFLGPKTGSPLVFVVDQVSENGRFDEHKCLLGFDNQDAAKSAYLANYPADWKCGEITALSLDRFQDWLENGDTTKPIAGNVERYTAVFEAQHPRVASGEHGGEFTEAHRSQIRSIVKQHIDQGLSKSKASKAIHKAIRLPYETYGPHFHEEWKAAGGTQNTEPNNPPKHPEIKLPPRVVQAIKKRGELIRKIAEDTYPSFGSGDVPREWQEEAELWQEPIDGDALVKIAKEAKNHMATSSGLDWKTAVQWAAADHHYSGWFAEQRRRQNEIAEEEHKKWAATEENKRHFIKQLEAALPGVEFSQAAGGSWYANYHGLKLRVSDHAQVTGGGFNQSTGERMGESDLQGVVKHNKQLQRTPEQIRQKVAAKLREIRDYGTTEPEHFTWNRLTIDVSNGELA